jgi:hypothetical protein
VANLPAYGHRILARDVSAAEARLHQPAYSEIALSVSRLIASVWIASAAVIAVGFFREMVLALAGANTVLGAMRHLAFDAPYSLPVWWQCVLMLCSALLLAFCTHLSRRHDPKNSAHWTVLTVVFFLFSADAAVGLHELVTQPLRAMLGLTNAFALSWILLGAPLLLAAGGASLAFLSRLPRNAARGITAAGVVFVSGAFGLELLSGDVAVTFGRESLAYRLCSSAEETLEIAGLTLFLGALLRLIAAREPLLSFRLR